MKIGIVFTLSFFLLSACASRQSQPLSKTEVSVGYDAELTNYRYPFHVEFYEFSAQKQKLRMAYMDIKLGLGKENAPTIVLLHGKNFSGFYFEKMAWRLHELGYRVIIPDQIGFGKSTKPTAFQYSFQALGSMTSALLDTLGVQNYILLGHSMGGMLALRMGLMYPDRVKKLILVNPIGLEDWKKLTPYRNIDEAYETELKSNPEKIKKYQTENYFSGDWKPEYDRLIEPASGWTKSPALPLIAWNSALTADMIFTQPVVYEFINVKVPTVLIIGQKDKTAIGQAWASDENKKRMGNYPVLGRRAAKAIPRARLYELAPLGHVPFIEDIDLFFKDAMMPALKR